MNPSESKTDPKAPTTATKNQPKKAAEEEAVPFSKIFRFATRTDWAYMILGTIAAMASGAGMPVSTLFLGDVADGFGPDSSSDEIVDAAATVAIKFIVLGLISFVVGYMAYAFWMITGERQSIEIRRRYFKALLTQEIAFFDSINPNEFSTRISEECFNIQQGIGQKIPTYVLSMSMLIAGFVLGYVKGWQLALILTGFLPIMMFTGIFFIIALQKMTKINTEAFAQAGAVSEEVLNAIRTVVSLGGQEKESRRYVGIMNSHTGAIVKYSVYGAISVGITVFFMYAIYALGFLMGSIFIEKQYISPASGKPYTAGDVLTVFFSVLIGSFAPMRATPCMKAFASAKVAAAKAFKIIDRKSLINIEDSKGIKPSSVTGDIYFNDVTFAYPLKKERVILDKISFHIKRNEKTALVGESGCGKTTCMQLIERFYDLESGCGSIKLDNNEITAVNLRWLRTNIGYVGQEPVLFATSIKENLMLAKEDATEDEIWQALKRANAYEFVVNLPQKLDTFVGSNGTQLSGGQKQRLAIARAILKNPPILLLDEATSALDRKNEMEIQQTLDEISKGRTTIVIAHRLTTIQNADHIIVFEGGKVVEEGKHEELVTKQGKYYALQHLQLQTQQHKDQKEGQDTKEVVMKKKISEIISANAGQVDDDKVPLEKEIDSPNLEVNALAVPDKQESKKKKNKKSKKEKEEEAHYAVLKRILSYNKGEWHLIFFGVLGAAIHGCVMPVLAFLLASVLEVFVDTDNPDFRKKANEFSLYFLIVAILAGVSIVIQMNCFTIASERLARRLRGQIFQKYVRMPVGWFDIPENAPGVLGAKLSTDTNLINNLVGSVFGMYIQAVSCLLVGIIIALAASWQLALIGIALCPLLILTGKVRAQFSQIVSNENDKIYQDSMAFVSEAVNNMRTVASFGTEDKLLKNYTDKLDQPLKAAAKNGHTSGISYGFGEFINFAINSLVFYIAALLIKDADLTFKDMFQCILAITFGALGAGNALQYSADYGAARKAAIGIFKVLDTKPAIDIDEPTQDYRKPIRGDIEFRNVWFKYPSREKQIFQGFNLKIDASKKVALVGPSGCGKSTILALLQRFYDPDQGQILIDGVDLKKFDLKHLRQCLGVVSQEPVLFNGTIEYNIKYTKENATDEEMRASAEEANALGFIEKNEFDVIEDDAEAASKYGTGFQRKVGPKGSQLSGGQKQRIAIARAILKKPSVLILDEATSALDAQNEKVVQESLDKIMLNKTSVIVAHRISTIRDADEIIVFSDGEIMERGNYQDLTAKQGIFYKLERGLNAANTH